MRKLTAVLSFVMFMAAAGLVFAQDVPAEKKEQSALGTFGGVIFMEYKQQVDEDQLAKFAMNRIFLDFKKDFGDIFSARIITDAAPEATSAGVQDKEGYELFIYNAYLQAAPKFDSVNLTVQAGVIPTPIVSYANSLTGIRWIGNTYLGDSKSVLTGPSKAIDSAVDLGVNCAVEIAKMVTISAALVKGEGSKEVTDSQGSLQYGPAYYAMVTANPWEKLFIGGFFKYKEELSDVAMTFYGASLAWKDSMLKTGLNFAMVNHKNGVDNSGYILDFWFNMNLESLAGMPILALAKAGYGDYEDAKNGIFGFGPGYQFNKNVQTALYYEIVYSKAAASGSDAEYSHSFYVKVEVKL